MSLCFPTFNALIAIHANPQKLGAIMGISESIYSLAMAAFPVVAAALYGIFGYPIYYGISILPISALVLGIVWWKKNKKLGLIGREVV